MARLMRASLLVLSLSCGCLMGADEPDTQEPDPASRDPPVAAAADPPRESGTSLAGLVDAHTRAGRAAAAGDVPPPIDPSLSPQERTQRAKALFMEGQRAFENGEYEQAAARFEEALAYAPDATPLVFKAGVAWERAGDCCRAQRRFRTFLHTAPADSPTRKEVERRIEGATCVC
jgi:tetratricopeptide (TPR) repeat protein